MNYFVWQCDYYNLPSFPCPSCCQLQQQIGCLYTQMFRPLEGRQRNVFMLSVGGLPLKLPLSSPNGETYVLQVDPAKYISRDILSPYDAWSEPELSGG